MIKDIALSVYIAVHLFGIIASISQVGKPRRVLTAGTAAGASMIGLACVILGLYALLRG